MQLRNSLSIGILAAFISLALTFPALAGDLEELDALDRDINKTSKEIKLQDLRVKLKELREKTSAKPDAKAPGAPAGAQGAARPGEYMGLPQVVSVEGFKGEFAATVEYENGVTAMVHQGDLLATGERVVLIDSRGVVVAKGQKRTRLPFSASISEVPRAQVEASRAPVRHDSATSPTFK